MCLFNRIHPFLDSLSLLDIFDVRHREKLNLLLSWTSLLFPRIPQTPQLVLTITLGSKSATSHFSLPKVFGPGVITHSNSPATSGAVDNDRTSLSTSVGENPVTKTGHLLASNMGKTGPHSVGDAICRRGFESLEVDSGEGNPNPGEKKKKRSLYGSRVCWN